MKSKENAREAMRTSLKGIRLLNPTDDIIQGNILHPEPHRQ